jgi:hypothetical protein
MLSANIKIVMKSYHPNSGEEAAKQQPLYTTDANAN